MAFLTDAASLTPEEIGELIVRPIRDESTALQVATVVNTGSHDFRIPIVNTDAAASWVAEGADITLTDPTVSELLVTPKKVAALTRLSREVVEDGSPEADALVQASLARSVARRVDAAFFGDTVTNGPSGLQSVVGTQVVGAGSTFADLDWAVAAKTKLRKVGSTATSFIANADTAESLWRIKAFTGDTDSNAPLLATDVTNTEAESILGVPLVTVADGTNLPNGRVWALDRAKVFVVIRRDVTIDVDSSVYFGSDSIAVRITCRIGFGFPHPQAVVKVETGGS